MATANKSVEAIVLSVAPEDEDDSCDEEPRELWRQAKVVQYGKKLTSGPANDGVGGSEEDVNVSARVQPFIKSHASRRQRAEASRSARRKRSQQQSDVGFGGHHGARHQRGSFSSTEVSTDEEDEVDDESDGNRSRRSGGSVGNSRRRRQPGVASNSPKSSSNSGPSYRTKQGSNKFKSRYGNTLRLEDAILTPGE